MPYVKCTREGAPLTVTYLGWPYVVAAGLEPLAAEALSEPGVLSVELLDDARSRIPYTERPRALVTPKRRAALNAVMLSDLPPC
ncbi:hypothetical protein [Protofrankia symbiont of Coriaria ruscifolia]|uniref:Uncharacterized protein n=1 Tax=Candidatus Protofrankia californiensis TaxID=1839754 RepID=A0A1C3NWD8_9ACTN|nr:hypothetical protein [Protofrankia symbiont of Coriaria ruscifolia]SBW20796.1 hypothetical protein FDG2_1809 [Candidatus Protofrankia californiensis]